MSELTDCKQPAGSAPRKRRQSPDQDESGKTPIKSAKVSEAPDETLSTAQSCKNGETESKETVGRGKKGKDSEGELAVVQTDHGSDVIDKAGGHDAKDGGRDAKAGGHDTKAGGHDAKAGGRDAKAGGRDAKAGGHDANASGHDAKAGGHNANAGGHDAKAGGHDAKAGGHDAKAGGRDVKAGGHDAKAGGHDAKAGGRDTKATETPQSSDARGSGDAKRDATGECHPSVSLDQSDSAAIAAAEALASLTGRDGEGAEETPCSSVRAGQEKRGSIVKQRGGHASSKEKSKTQAAAADSSTSVHSVDREDAENVPDPDDGDDSIPGSSSTPSSSFPSDNEDNDDGECAIVSVKMAPEIRQSVALLAQVQMRLGALEKKSARLHQRLSLKMSRLRRPHLDQRSSITKTIPGFWVTALLNHHHLSAHIDETDEDALSYMTDLEIESFKNNKMGYRIRFHFKRNPYFQNSIIMKELHLGMGGTPVSFSNPILWQRGQNLTAHSEPRKSARGVYQTFFSWFSDHSNPGRDDVAQILKDDLYRDPLRYYLTPLWEPRENGSSSSGARAAGNSNRDDCVVISDSDDDDDDDDDDQEPGEAGRGRSREEEEEEEEEEDEDEEERGQNTDESPEEDEDGDIVIDGSDDSDQEVREDEEESFEELYVDEEESSSRKQKARDQDDEEDVEANEEDESKD